MHRQTLNGIWEMSENTKYKWYEAKVPGSVMSSLLDQGVIEDPFWRLNEYEARELFRKDYVFQRDFVVNEEVMKEDNIELICYGLDTIAELSINGVLALSANNMHRIWKIPCKDLLKEGTNHISIVFRSPINYIETYQPKEGKEIDFVTAGAMKGNQYLRKAHSMFGWDWGMQIPDAGIWRDIEIVGYSEARLEDVEITQKHEADQVSLILRSLLSSYQSEYYHVKYSWITPDGKEFQYEQTIYDQDFSYEIVVEKPELWWPNGYGGQPLYHLSVTVENAQGHFCDSKEFTIGLRTITISQEKDEWGSEFAFKVNGIKIFTKGANYIPEDVVYSRITEERLEYLVKSSVRANYNCLRIWGGGYYPSDAFYELCNRYGIIVWQDLMYACNIYELSEEFEKNIVQEAIDNVKRLRHHPCLGIWCGNNEVESAWISWGDFKKHSKQLKADYIKQFEYVLPNVVNKQDGSTFYWPSSPSSGGGFDGPDDKNWGDVHYWEVWHGQKPFEDYRNYHFRFCSEFGFQSFPSEKTIKTFTEEADRNIFSEVMESHQKNNAANGKILYYISENFLYPKDFKSLIYVSQVLQGIAIKFGVEHWRRNRGRCMGSLYWQLNDNCQISSWSSIDYFGRWKALHYMAKNFYAPVALSLARTNRSVEVSIQNESMQASSGEVRVSLKSLDFDVLDEEILSVSIPPLSALTFLRKEYEPLVKGREGEVFLEAVWTNAQGEEQLEVVTFLPYKHVALRQGEIQTRVVEEEDRYRIYLKSNTFACFVELDFKEADGIFSDNYFFITSKEEKEIYIMKSDMKSSLQYDEFVKQLEVRSLRDTY